MTLSLLQEHHEEHRDGEHPHGEPGSPQEVGPSQLSPRSFSIIVSASAELTPPPMTYPIRV